MTRFNFKFNSQNNLKPLGRRSLKQTKCGKSACTKMYQPPHACHNDSRITFLRLFRRNRARARFTTNAPQTTHHHPQALLSRKQSSTLRAAPPLRAPPPPPSFIAISQLAQNHTLHPSRQLRWAREAAAQRCAHPTGTRRHVIL